MVSVKTQYTVRRDFVAPDGDPDVEHLGSFRNEADAVEFARQKSAFRSGEFAVTRFELCWMDETHEWEVVDVAPLTVCVGGEEVQS